VRLPPVSERRWLGHHSISGLSPPSVVAQTRRLRPYLSCWCRFRTTRIRGLAAAAARYFDYLMPAAPIRTYFLTFSSFRGGASVGRVGHDGRAGVGSGGHDRELRKRLREAEAFHPLTPFLRKGGGRPAALRPERRRRTVPARERGRRRSAGVRSTGSCAKARSTARNRHSRRRRRQETK
jgi:hypothetical protein